MTCRVACQPEPLRHWPVFSVPGLPDGFAYCLVCWDYLTAVGLFDSVCSGYPPESREPGPLDPVTASAGRSESATGHAFISACDLERERTLGMIQRCAEHQL